MISLAHLLEFARPISEDRVPMLREHAHRGVSGLALLTLFLCPGGALSPLVALITGAGHLERSLVVACILTSLSGSVWLATQSKWALDHLVWLQASLTLTLLASGPLQAWAVPELISPVLVAYLALPVILAVYTPTKPWLVATSQLPALITYAAAKTVLEGQPHLPSVAVWVVAIPLAAGGAVAAQMLRRLWAEVEASKAQILAAGRMVTLGRLSAGIAHELKTPIAAILNAEATAEQLLEELRASIGHPQVTEADLREIIGEISEQSTRIRSSAERAGRFVRAVREHTIESRADSEGRIHLATQVASVVDFLSFRTRRSLAKIRIEDITGDLSLMGPAQRFDQILTNLITNALDVCDETGQSHQVTISAIESDREVRIVVEDDGPGVPEPLRQRIFEPLVTTRSGGTGLGLTISRDIAQACFGGTLELTGPSRFELICPSR